jgi:hypothetical protein
MLFKWVLQSSETFLTPILLFYESVCNPFMLSLLRLSVNINLTSVGDRIRTESGQAADQFFVRTGASPLTG